MKAIAIYLVLSLVPVGGLLAQERSVQSATTTVVVPDAAKTTFEKEFPGLQAKWEADGKNFKAVYADPKTNSKGIIIYDAAGQVLRRDMEANPSVPK